MSWQQPYNPAYSQPPPSGPSPPYNPASSVPPSSYGAPPQSSWAPPNQSVGGYGNPSGSFGPRGHGHGSVGAGFGSPTSTYGPPASGGQNYGAPATGGYEGGPPSQPPLDPELMSWFTAVDKDHSGKITAVELREALLNSNWSHFNAETCRLLIGMFDRNGDGTIDVHEFAALWKYVQEWKSCFNKFDKDGSGNIDAMELQQALLSFGYRLSMDFCNMCTRVFDRADRRTMKFDDFIQCCVMLRSLTEGFKKLDTNRSGVINVSYEQFLQLTIDNTIT